MSPPADMVDCADEYENLSAFEAYLTEALRTPFFMETWGQGPRAKRVTVLGVASSYNEDGVLMRVRLSGGTEREVLAEKL